MVRIGIRLGEITGNPCLPLTRHPSMLGHQCVMKKKKIQHSQHALSAVLQDELARTDLGKRNKTDFT
ncbi:hypothetical protein RRG08_021644 [Elysia crispata]|uniref:Uncharacterized protein n=1 Tax=Elysia crispata TaxID=231223 RepID=A0AAE0XEB2_9GAST|nr:hypothetical protein RRG08_021644 [Elysia crispata]